jgi:hypothetical protein
METTTRKMSEEDVVPAEDWGEILLSSEEDKLPWLTIALRDNKAVYCIVRHDHRGISTTTEIDRDTYLALSQTAQMMALDQIRELLTSG